MTTKGKGSRIKHQEVLSVSDAIKYTKLIETKGIMSVSVDIQDILVRDFMLMYTRAITRANELPHSFNDVT